MPATARKRNPNSATVPAAVSATATAGPTAKKAPTSRKREAAAPAASGEAWMRTVNALGAAKPGRPRAEALLATVDEAAAADPELARFRFSLLATMRAALASEGIAAGMSGSPRIIVEGIELPGFGSEEIAREATLRGLVRARIFEQDMLAASAVAEIVGSRSTNPRQYANKARLRSEIVGVPWRNQYLYPRFQFDEEHGCVRPEAGEVNRVVRAVDDPWGVASWWVSANGRLDGRTPADVLVEGSDAAVLVELARGGADDVA